MLRHRLAGRFFAATLLVAVCGEFFIPAARAGTLYWDTNGTTAGAGTGSGVWGGATPSSDWTTSAAGTTAPSSTYTPNSDVVFSAGNPPGVSPTSMGIGSPEAANSMTFQSPGNNFQIIPQNTPPTTIVTTITLGGGGGGGNTPGIIVASSATNHNFIITVPILFTPGVTETFSNAGTGILGVDSGVSGSANLILDNNASAVGGVTIGYFTFATPGAVNNNLNVTGTITNAGTGSGSTIINTIISGTATAVIQNSATSQLTLTAGNLYTAPTTISAGTLSVALIANGGVASGLGQSSNAAANLVFNGSTLQYTGGPASTDRNFTINPGTTATFGVTAAATNLTLFGGTGATTGGLTKTGAGSLTLSGANSYTGLTTVSLGTLQFGQEAAFYSDTPASWTPANILVSSGATLGLNVGGTGEFTTADVGTLLDNSHLGGSTASTGLKSGSTLALDTTDAAGGNFTYSAAIVNPFASANVLGLTKLGPNTLTLSGANNYTGPTTIAGGTLRLSGSLAASSPVTISGGGTFNYAGAAAGSSATDGTLAFSGGDDTVQSTYGGSGNTSLTFSSLAARTAGATGNFVVSGGTNGTTNKIVLTGQATGVIDQGTFFNGGNFAYYDASGFVRGISYSGSPDPNAESIAAPTAATTPGMLYEQISGSGAITAEPTQAISTLVIANGNNFTQAAGTTLTVKGIIKTGNSAGGTIGGGTGITTGPTGELVIRTDGPGDTLTISTPIVNGTGITALTKSGLGTATLNFVAAPTTGNYSGTTTVNAGTLNFLLFQTNLVGQNTGAVSVAAGATLAITANAANTLNAGATFANTFTGAGTVTFAGNYFTAGLAGDWSGFTGTVNVNTSGGGSLTATAFSFNSAATVNVASGATYNALNSNGSVTLLTNSFTIAGTGNSTGSGAMLLNSPTAVSGSVALLADSVIESTGAGMNSISGAISGPFGLTFTGGGVGGVPLSLMNPHNSYSGGTTVANFGNLQLGASNAIPAGDLFVLAGGIFSLDTFNQTVNGLSGTGTVDGLLGTPTLTVGNNNATSSFSGVIKNTAGSLAITKIGTGTLTLSGANTYGGVTTVNAGTLQFATAGSLYGGTTASWTATNIVVNSGATLAFNVGGASDFSKTGSTTNLDTIKAIGTASGGFTSGSSLGLDTTNGNFTYGTVIANTNSGANVLGLTKLGANTLSLSALNTYSGPTTVAAGTLNVDFVDSASTTNLINSASALTLAGGGLAVSGKASTANSQTFASLALSAGTSSIIVVTSGATGGTANLTLNAITANAAASIDFTLPASGSIQTSTANTGGTLLGGWATINGGTDWATSAGNGATNGNITPLNSTNTNWGSGIDTQVVGTNTANDVVANSLRFRNGASAAVTLAGASSLQSGAILMTPTAAAASISGPSLTAGNNALIVNQQSSSSLTINAALIDGPGSTSLTVFGTGALILGGANSYSGGTNLVGGTLSLASSSALGTTGTISLTGGTLQFTAANTTDYSPRFSTAPGQIYRIDTGGQNVSLAASLGSPNSTLTKLGGGTLTLNGTNNFGGGTTVSAGTLNLGSYGALGTVGPITLSGGTLQYSAGNNRDYSPRFSGAPNQLYNVDTNGQNVTWVSPLTSIGGILTKSGAGDLTLGGANTFTGGVNLNAGTLTLTGTPGANGPINFNGGILQLTTSTDYSLFFSSAPNQQFIIDSGSGQSGLGVTPSNGVPILVSVGGSFTKLGTGTINLRDPAGYTGTTTISAGTLGLASTGGNVGSGNIIDNGTFNFNRSVPLTTSNVISGTGGISRLNTTANDAWTLTGANTYTGPTLVTAGTLQAGVASIPGVSGAFGVNSAVTMVSAATAILDLNGLNTQIGSLTGGGSVGGNVTLEAATLTVGGDNTSPAAYGGVISSTGSPTTSLVKIGTGTLTLSGGNSYTGATLVNAGTLLMSGSGNLATGSTVTVNDGATLSGIVVSSSTPTVNGPVILAGATTGAALSGTLSLGNTLTVTGGGNNNIPVGSTIAVGQPTTINSGGSLAVNGTLGGTGSVAVNGTLRGSGTIGSSKSVTVNFGGAIAGASGSTLTILNGLTFTDNSTSNFALTPQGVGNSAALVNVTNGLTLANGINTINFTGHVAQGTYDLYSFDNGPSTLNQFALGTVPTDNFGYQLAIVGNQIDLKVGPSPVSGVWNLAGDGSFGGTTGLTNWDPTQNIPTGVGLSATFGVGTSNSINHTTVPSGTISVSVNGVFTDGTLVFDNSAVSYTLANDSGAGHGLTLNNGGAVNGSFTGAAIMVNSGSHTIAANLTLADSAGTTFDLVTGTSLAVSGIIAGSGANQSLTLTGGGTLTLSNTNTYNGGTTVNSSTLRTTGTGALGGGPLAINADTVNSSVTIGSTESVGSLSSTQTGGGGAVSLTVDHGGSLTVNQSSSATIPEGLTLNAPFHALAAGAFAKSGSGTLRVQGPLNVGTFVSVQSNGSGKLEFDGAASLGDNSSATAGGSSTLEFDGSTNLGNNIALAANGTGTLRFHSSGSASVGSGVVATVASGATLELAGPISAIGSAGGNRAAIQSNGNLLVSGTGQVVAGIDGSGTVSVNTGSDLTADHITAGGLVIGGDATHAGLLTIDPSNPDGSPMAQPSGFTLAGSLTPSAPFASDGLGTSSLLAAGDSYGSGPSLGDSTVGSSAAAVPEPSTIVLSAVASLAGLLTAFRRTSRSQALPGNALGARLCRAEWSSLTD